MSNTFIREARSCAVTVSYS